MANIPKPELQSKDSDRHLMCQMAVEGYVQGIVDRATRAGWRPAEVLTAITEVADNLILAQACNVELDELLASPRRKPPAAQ
jgi:hypothetical protein